MCKYVLLFFKTRNSHFVLEMGCQFLAVSRLIQPQKHIFVYECHGNVFQWGWWIARGGSGEKHEKITTSYTNPVSQASRIILNNISCFHETVKCFSFPANGKISSPKPAFSLVKKMPFMMT